MKNKYLIFILFLVVFIFADGGLTHAALEIKDYPSIPGLITPSANCTANCLAILVSYWFGILIYVAGILALISFTVGAVGLIASIDNAERQSNAKDRMKGAILGLVLVLASFIIARTINPTFITPTLTPPPGVSGIFYYNGSAEAPVAMEVSDVANRGEDLINGGFNSIKYNCTSLLNGLQNNTTTIAPTLMIWEFPKPGLEQGNGDLNSVSVKRIECGGIEPISGLGSFKMAFESPGIYYYLKPNCQGYASLSAKTSSEDQIGAPFFGNIASVRTVSDYNKNLVFGVIFHKGIGLESGGECMPPILSNPGSYTNCYPVDYTQTHAADIFLINRTPVTSGNGVSFFSEPFGWDTGAKAGFYPKPGTPLVIESPKTEMSADEMCFDYTNIAQPDPYKYKCLGGGPFNSSIYNNCGQSRNGIEGVDCSSSACETFQDCPGSINVKGSYLVGLYSNIGNNKWYCQTFIKNVDNLYAQPFIASGGNKLDKIYIIPTQ